MLCRIRPTRAATRLEGTVFNDRSASPGREGKSLVTDGPFAETREQLGGFFLVNAQDLDEAITIATQIPGARVGTVEIRPVLEVADLPGS